MYTVYIYIYAHTHIHIYILVEASLQVLNDKIRHKGWGRIANTA